jgi:TonB family protein
MDFKSYTVVSPEISYTVTEAGTTENVQIVKSSGDPVVDQWVVSRHRRTRFKSRPKCGSIEMEATVPIRYCGPYPCY